MANEASIVIPVEMDDKQAKAELNRLNREMLKLQQQMAANQDRKSTISEQLKEAQAQLKETRQDIIDVNAAIRENKNVINSYSGGGVSEEEYAYAQKALRQLLKNLTQLNAKRKEEEATVARISLQETQIDGRLQEQNAQYDLMKEQVGAIQQKLINAGSGGLKNFLGNIKEKFSGLISGLKGSNNGFKMGLSTILKYGFGIRSLYMLINKLRTGLKEGIQSFAQYDSETRSSLDGLKSSLSTLKASWGAAFAPIINAVTPILQSLISMLARAANAVASFMAILSGRGTYKKAVANQKALADGLSGAGGAAEEAQKQLAGFDEITKLEDNSGSGGGGGGAGDGLDFVEENVDQTLKDLIDKGDWRGVGSLIADKMNEAISNLDAAGTAQKISEKVKNALELSAGFLEELDGYQIGQKISEFITNIDWAGITSGISENLGALIGFLGSFALGLLAEPFQKVYDFFKERIDSWKEVLPDDSSGVGFAIIMGILEGIWDAIKGIGVWIYDNIFKPFWDGICEAFQIHSPSRVMMEVGRDIVQGMLNGITEKWNSLTSWLEQKWNSLKSWWQGLSLGSFDFKTPHLEVAWEALADNSVLAKMLGITAIPHLSVKWYAKGGIVDGATLIGAGEAGKEAIIPLERNTEWITKVAKQISEMLFYNNVFDRIADQVAKIPDALDRYAVAMNNIPLPAMASGSVVPPMISVSAFDTEWGNNILGKLNELSDRLQALSERDFVGHSTIDIDRRKVGEVVTRYQREQERAGR